MEVYHGGFSDPYREWREEREQDWVEGKLISQQSPTGIMALGWTAECLA
jgi:hypothetical protein